MATFLYQGSDNRNLKQKIIIRENLGFDHLNIVERLKMHGNGSSADAAQVIIGISRANVVFAKGRSTNTEVLSRWKKRALNGYIGCQTDQWPFIIFLTMPS